MRTPLLALTLFLGTAVLFAGLLPFLTADTADAARIAKLIRQLGSGRFEEREQATRELEALGGAALEGLRKAAQSGDLETQRRAEELVKKLEGRLSNAQMLAATRVRFKFKDTPVLEAIADIAKKTGFHLSYVDDPAKIVGRTVTVDTGETTFWQAFDLFCQKAGLVEGAGQYRAAGPQPVAIAVGGQPPPPVPVPPIRHVLPPNSIQPTFGAYRHVMLLDGKPQPLPTDYVGAVRVRALPPEIQLLGAAPRLDNELRVLVDLSPEPGVDFVGVLDMRIDKAVNDRGQSLKGLAGAAAGDPVAVALATASRPLGRQVPVRLEPAAQPSRALKELKGTSTVQMRTPPKVMATVDDIQNATGKSVKGEHNVTLTVRDVKRHEDGRLELTVLVQRPADVFAYNLANAGGAAGLIPVQAGQIQIQIRQIQVAPGAVPQQRPPAPGAPPPPAPNPAPKPAAQKPAPQPVQAQPVQAQIAAVQGRTFVTSVVGLSVLDAKDQQLALTDARMAPPQTVKGVTTQEVTLTVQPQAGQGAPAKLVFNGTRHATVEIAFTLKDVPLP